MALVDAVCRSPRPESGHASAPKSVSEGASLRHGGSMAEESVDVSVIMPTIFWTGTFERCARRILAVIDATPVKAEVIFAFDGVPPATPSWLNRPGVRIVSTGVRSGPAIARNRAAELATGEILFFVDADVELATDTLDRIDTAFAADPDLVGLFGAYDDEPTAMGVASVFRNLLHHHTHASHPGQAVTFWSGCGAIRRRVFLDVGGFDENFAYPSVEDIELGMRIVADGGRILLAPDLLCKHLKHWTLGSMIHTDIVHRASPWTRLIVNSHALPDTLNLDWRSRVSGVCSLLLAVCVLVSCVSAPNMIWGALACGLVLLALNGDFYSLCLKKHGAGFAVSAMFLHWCYFVYSSTTFAVVSAHEVWLRFRRSLTEQAHLKAASGAKQGV